MARIRTIKPEFFTSEDIVSLPALTRLLYIATWCEADREGRLAWKPMTFKLRYFPADNCDIQAMCKELIDAGLVVLYGNGFAYIPKFSNHQHINPRESESSIQSPDVFLRVVNASTRDSDGESTVSDAQVGREGKERKGTRVTTDAAGPPEPQGFLDFWSTWPTTDRKQARGKCLEVWKKARLDGDAAVILAHVERMKSSPDWRKESGQFIPAPLVYLNQRRWDGAGDDGPVRGGLLAGAI